MTDRLRIDIETYSPVPIDAGVYAYAGDAEFRILMAGWHINDEPTRMAVSQKELWELCDLIADPSIIKVAHNAQFERICFSRFVNGHTTGGFLPPAEWHDTMAIAAVNGWPQSLGKLADALGVAPKDSAGTRLINLFSRPRPRTGLRALPQDHMREWVEFMEYCRQDVDTLREVDVALGYDWPTETEHEIYLTDQAINDRGANIDVEMARAAWAAAVRGQERALDRIQEITGVENPNSRNQVLEWLRWHGLTDLTDLQADTVRGLLEHREDLREDVREVLELRSETALTASKKYAAALQGAGTDGRLRGQFRYFGAHTGRWSGRGVQLQNLPRAGLKPPPPRPGESDQEYWSRCDLVAEEAILDLKLSGEATATELKQLVRPMFTGPLCVVDYSAIEARVVAWLAGENWALKAFASGRDIYVETAERMSTPGHHLDRSQGKVAVLALGYNGAVNSLRAMGAEGSDDDLRRLVVSWRRANRKIVGLWRMLDEAFYRGGDAGPHLTVHARGRDRELVLPSGRSLVYHNCHFTHDRGGSRRAVFDSPTGYQADTYGGRLTENATQAVARDILGEALVRLETEGYRVVGHVHDEVLVEAGPEHLQDIISLMNTPPEWAAGLPIASDGYACRRYRKG